MAGLSADPVNTCSIGFTDPAYDEAAYAKRVADQYRTNHRVETVESDDFDLIDRLARIYDEPYADSSAIPTFRVCELARKSVTVALSGDGGDENFAGYRRYRFQMSEERVRGLLPASLRRSVFGRLGRAYPKLDWAPRMFRAKSTLQSLARDAVEGYFETMSVLRGDQRASLYSDSFRRRLGGYNAVDTFFRHARHAQGYDPLSLVQYLDLKTYLVGDINTKVDRASMAHSLEVREPLMDHPLVEWLATLPLGLKVRNGEGKYLLKKAMEPLLPHDLLYRQKMGFAVPLGRWFRGPLRERVREVDSGRPASRHRIFRAELFAPLGRTASVRASGITARPCGRCSCSKPSCATWSIRKQSRGPCTRLRSARDADPSRAGPLASSAQRLFLPDTGNSSRAAGARLGHPAAHHAAARHDNGGRRRGRRISLSPHAAAARPDGDVAAGDVRPGNGGHRAPHR